MLTVVETPEFIATASGIWNEEERHTLIEWLSKNPDAGEVIPATRGLRKLRWARPGMGKRGGARVIYYVRTARGDLMLVTAYTKGRIENIPAHLLRAIVEKYDA